jgi:hypothetical protein
VLWLLSRQLQQRLGRPAIGQHIDLRTVPRAGFVATRSDRTIAHLDIVTSLLGPGCGIAQAAVPDIRPD